MTEKFEFIVYKVKAEAFNTKLLLGVNENVGIWTYFSPEAVKGQNISAGCRLLADEAVLVGEPETTYEIKRDGKQVYVTNAEGQSVKATGLWKMPQQRIALGGNIEVVQPVRATYASPQVFVKPEPASV